MKECLEQPRQFKKFHFQFHLQFDAFAFTASGDFGMFFIPIPLWSLKVAVPCLLLSFSHFQMQFWKPNLDTHFRTVLLNFLPGTSKTYPIFVPRFQLMFGHLDPTFHKHSNPQTLLKWQITKSSFPCRASRRRSRHKSRC